MVHQTYNNTPAFAGERNERMEPANLLANGLWNPFKRTKKYHIQCGSCYHGWAEKVSAMTDLASAICPNCRQQNTWSHGEFARHYDTVKAERDSA
ncbi:MAG: hypothetical protein KAV87_31355 [Desulfobacteraceae bacterium]|nr:hypothetical protein [Desulfobacteraceae bacterium]